MNGSKKILCIICVLIILLPMLSGCDSVSFTPGNPQKLAFSLKDDGTYSVALGKKTHLDRIEIPKTYRGKAVTEIGSFGHADAPNIYLKEIIIPDSITTISASAFEGCEALDTIELPSSVTTIGARAFYNCVDLFKIVIPDSVTSMSPEAFYGCKNLMSVTLSSNLSRIGMNSFYGCVSLLDIDIPHGVSSIGARAFYGCTSLKGLTIPDSVTRIEKEAFYKCPMIKELVIPDSVTYIGEGAFALCGRLNKITLPFAGAEKDSAGNSGLRHIFGGELPRSLKTVVVTSADSIGEMAFYGCSSITNVILPDGISKA